MPIGTIKVIKKKIKMEEISQYKYEYTFFHIEIPYIYIYNMYNIYYV